jgi:CheY-like chemotaxis protein
MDLEMPRMDGAACCQTIKSYSATSNVPVVMVTAKDNADKYFSAGCDFFLPKPLD